MQTEDYHTVHDNLDKFLESIRDENGHLISTPHIRATGAALLDWAYDVWMPTARQELQGVMQVEANMAGLPIGHQMKIKRVPVKTLFTAKLYNRAFPERALRWVEQKLKHLNALLENIREWKHLQYRVIQVARPIAEMSEQRRPFSNYW